MRFESVQDKIERAVSKAEKVTGKNLTLPVLKCLLLIAKDNVLTIRATNLDLGVEIKIPVKVEKEGVVAIPADVLKSFLSSLPKSEGKVSFELKEKITLLTTPHTKTQIKTFPYEEFPSIPVVSDSTAISLPVDALISGLKSVWYSASPSSMKPELSSVYIYSEGGDLKFAATDSFRLAEKKVSLKKSKEIPKLLIPHKNVAEIIRLFESSDGEIELLISENQIAFRKDGIYVTSRVIDGVFPDYGQIIPKESLSEAVMLRDDLFNNLKLSNIFSDKFNQVTFTLSPKKKEFYVETHNSDVGENISKVDAALKGDEIEMSFNYRYIIDSFQSINTDSVTLSFSDGKPLVIKGVGDTSFLYLVMPMNR